MRKLIYPNECNDNGRILVIHSETPKTMVVDLYNYYDNDIELYEEDKVNIRQYQKTNRYKIYIDYARTKRYICFNSLNMYYLENGLTEEEFRAYLKKKCEALLQILNSN
jgi:hypothetical protein